MGLSSRLPGGRSTKREREDGGVGSEEGRENGYDMWAVIE